MKLNCSIEADYQVVSQKMAFRNFNIQCSFSYIYLSFFVNFKPVKDQKLFIAPLLILAALMQGRAQSAMESLTKYAGDWNANYIMWMDASSAPMSFQISVHNEMKMNNLFFTSYYTGNVMDMTYEGVSTIAYDLQKGKFESMWIDNMNSGINYMEGKASDDKKSIEFHKTTCDQTAGRDLPMRQVLILTDATHQKIEMFTMMNGKEMKTIEIDLTKK
jgi:hypothetical protein